MYVSLFGVCSIHSGYCTGDSIRVDIQIADPHGNLLGGQQPCTQIIVEKLNVLVIASELTSRFLSIMAIYWEASRHAPK